MCRQSLLVNRAVRLIAETMDVNGGAWTVETLGSKEAVEQMRDKWLDL